MLTVVIHPSQCVGTVQCAQLVFDWTMSKGVERQFTALKNGFNTVFPLHYLSIFHPEEVCS